MKGDFATFQNEVEILKNTFGSDLVQRVISISIIIKKNHFNLFKCFLNFFYGYLIFKMRCQ